MRQGTTRVAFVCLGNICRSPMAEAVARSLVAEAGLAGRVTVESFGTAGYHVGEGADRQADAALARHGWPDGGHKARQITAADVEAIDLVLCADRANLAAVQRLGGPSLEHSRVRLLRSYDPAAAPGAEVPDPWGMPDSAFDEALQGIEAACRGLVAELAGRSD